MSGTAATLPVADLPRTRRETLRRFGRRRLLTAGTVLVLLTGTVATLAQPALLGAVVDVVADGGPASRLWWLIGALVVSGVIGAALTGAGQVLMATLCEHTLAELREDVFEVVMDRPLAEIERVGIGDVVGRVSGDVDTIRTAISSVLPAFTSALFTIGVAVVGMGLLDPRFAAAALLAVPIQAMALRWFLRRSGPVYRAERVAEAERARTVLEPVASAPTVQATGTAGWHLGRVETASLRAIDLRVRGIELLTHFFNRLNAAELVGLSAVLVTGFWLVDAGAASVGAATAAALYFHRLFDPVFVLLTRFDDLQQAGAGLSRLIGVTHLRRPAAPIPGATGRISTSPVAAGGPTPGGTGSAATVQVQQVRHTYGGEHVALDDVDLRVARGEHVALVGPSGAGKTTLASLVAGIHRPDRGRVLVDGVDVADVPSEQLRRKVALVSQEIHVFSGTLADDLRLARPNAGDADLLDALAAVGAWWATDLPEGLDTVIGTGGTALSGERAQQLALARLLLADPAVAVLDEATAEAGSSASTVLDRAAQVALAGRTSIVVAHRLTQAAAADRIVVLAEGRVAESGSHDELVRSGGRYATLWATWSRHPAPGPDRCPRWDSNPH